MNRDALLDVVEATWPAARVTDHLPWRFRESPGGGKRVTAASPLADITEQDVKDAKAWMQTHGQAPLFSLLPGSETDTTFAQNGYVSVDETLFYHCQIAQLTTHKVPPVTAFPIWPPLQLARDIWAEAGIGPDRLAVMERAACEKTAILGRVNGRAGGVVYAGLHQGCVMIHALEVMPAQRRHRLGQSLVIAAAHWGAKKGATDFALLVTQANTAGNALYTALGMTPQRGYHYRVETN